MEMGNLMKNTIIMWTMMVLLSLLTACGGSDSSEGSRFAGESESESESDTGDDEVDSTNVSFLPLMTIERYAEWFNDTDSDVFLAYGKSPLINYYLINPINASTLEPITTAQASDFSIKEDDVEVNPKVGFPLLQKVLGNTVVMSTAIVINTSTAMDGVDKAAFIQEIKDYVTAAKSSTTSYIANQRFTVWGYDGQIVEETNGFKSNVGDIHSALDTVLTKWENATYGINTGSNYTYDALVHAIGRYVGDGAFSESAAPLTLRDSVSGEDNDLVDYITPDVVYATSVVLFSAGNGNSNRFDTELVVQALESQSTLAYEVGVELAGTSTEVVNYPKTFIYVVPNGEPVDPVLENSATSVIKNSISDSEYSFAANILSAQKIDIDKKTALDNQHVLRWASAFRGGTGHTRVLSTRTSDDQHGYALTVDGIDFDPALTLEMPTPQVEITGANNEYLASGVIYPNDGSDYDSAIAYADEITRFYPATRWTNQEFSSSDYTWSSTPASAFTLNSDGSVTIDTDSLPITLVLTNSNIDDEGGIISDDFTLTIKASK